MIRIMFAALTLIVLLPFQVSAQGTAAQRLDAARARAAEAGIPLELIENRILEGRAKGIPEDRIADAIERRGQGLSQARQAMIAAGITPSAADLSTGADALEAGVDANSLRAVLEAARAQDRPVALAVLGELVRQGLPVQEARDRVRAALQRRDGKLADLPRQAAAERAGPRGPNGAAAGRQGGGGPPANPGRDAASQGGRPTTVPGSGRGANGNGRP